MSVVATPTKSDQRFLLTGMSWQFYEHLLREVGDRHILVTYDRGDLELIAPSFPHERYARCLGQFVEILAEELEMSFKCGGTTTFRKEDLDRGLEPDECFYIASISRILGKSEIDLAVDPPPDLAIEIDITSSSIDRMNIYAALRVPEIWRYDGETLRAYRMTDAGEYEQSQQSLAFPTVPLDKIDEFLDECVEADDFQLRRAFRKWVREQVLTDE